MRRLRMLSRPLAASMGVHLIALAVLAWLVIGGSEHGPLQVPAPLTATLVSSAAPPLLPPEEPVTVPSPPEPPRSIQPDPRPALLPVPVKPRPVPIEKGSPQGRVSVNVLPSDYTIDPGVAAILRQRYPEASRAEVRFEVRPTGVYPKAALADKRQLQLNVVAIVHEDGRVEVAEGTSADPIYTPAIVATLASAKADPPEQPGGPAMRWVLLEFLFEYVGTQ